MYKFFSNIIKKKHNNKLYNIILSLSRNIFFYERLNLPDNYQSRINLMLFHFSIMIIVAKKHKVKFDQHEYDSFFKNIEYNLRELGYGDVSVNSKMKDFNKILYDILLKIEDDKIDGSNVFKLNYKLVAKYFETIDIKDRSNINQFELYFSKFFDFCFELGPISMLKDLDKFKY